MKPTKQELFELKSLSDMLKTGMYLPEDKEMIQDRYDELRTKFSTYENTKPK